MNRLMTDNASFLLLTNHDLYYRSRHKSFEEITLSDFNYSLTEALTASHVIFVDDRQREGLWKRILGLSGSFGKKVKQLRP